MRVNKTMSNKKISEMLVEKVEMFLSETSDVRTGQDIVEIKKLFLSKIKKELV
jgi:hypothetical protein